jgi:hypothetical protein
MYRLAKKYWFYDFKAYQNVAHDAEAKARQLQSSLAKPPAARDPVNV